MIKTFQNNPEYFEKIPPIILCENDFVAFHEGSLRWKISEKFSEFWKDLAETFSVLCVDDGLLHIWTYCSKKYCI